MIFNACSKKNKIYNLKSEKTHGFWQSDSATKLPEEKFDKLCSDSINDSELQDSLSSDFQNFLQKDTPDFSEIYLNMIDKIKFCKNW